MKKIVCLFGLIPLLLACNKPGDCVECSLIKNSWMLIEPETLRTYSGCWPRISNTESECFDDASLLNKEGTANYSCSCTVIRDND